MRTYIPDGYEISKYRYRELLAFCRQYDELRRMQSACYTIASPDLSGMPHSSSVGASTVERQADRARRYAERVECLEHTARTASEGSELLYRCLLDNVARGIAFEHLDCPCGRRKFYEMRRKFFFLLDKAA